MDNLPDSLYIPFFQMVGYPVLASEMMTRKFLFGQLNGEKHDAGNYEEANYAARLSDEAADSIRTLTEIYNSINNGKWKGMMRLAPGWCAKYQNDAHLVKHPEVGETVIDLSIPKDISEIKCQTINLRDFKSQSAAQIIEGLGYDGYSVKLGSDVEEYPYAPELTYELKGLKGDSTTLQVFHIPFFPLYEGARCRFAVSFDGGEEQIKEYIPKEWSAQWNENVLRNSALSTFCFPLSTSKKSHTLKIRSIDPGLVIQRIVIDEGGFKPGYVGPDLNAFQY